MEKAGRSFAALVKEIRRQFGVSYATVNRWEKEQSKPSKLAKRQLGA